MVVADTYIPVRRLQRLAPVPIIRLKPRWGRIALFAAFLLAQIAAVAFPAARAWFGLFMLFDVTVFVLTDKRPQLVRVVRHRTECGA